MKVSNKLIVLTSGGSGIGLTLLSRLISKGARVAAGDLNENSDKETV